jgi:hypothetical protein
VGAGQGTATNYSRAHLLDGQDVVGQTGGKGTARNKRILFRRDQGAVERIGRHIVGGNRCDRNLTVVALPVGVAAEAQGAFIWTKSDQRKWASAFRSRINSAFGSRSRPDAIRPSELMHAEGHRTRPHRMRPSSSFSGIWRELLR